MKPFFNVSKFSILVEKCEEGYWFTFCQKEVHIEYKQDDVDQNSSILQSILDILQFQFHLVESSLLDNDKQGLRRLVDVSN
jgi:hypothetical protein